MAHAFRSSAGAALAVLLPAVACAAPAASGYEGYDNWGVNVVVVFATGLALTAVWLGLLTISPERSAVSATST